MPVGTSRAAPVRSVPTGGSFWILTIFAFVLVSFWPASATIPLLSQVVILAYVDSDIDAHGANLHVYDGRVLDVLMGIDARVLMATDSESIEGILTEDEALRKCGEFAFGARYRCSSEPKWIGGGQSDWTIDLDLPLGFGRLDDPGWQCTQRGLIRSGGWVEAQSLVMLCVNPERGLVFWQKQSI